MKGTGLFLLLLFGSVLCFVYLRSSNYLLHNLKVAFHYITANQAHGYSKLAYQFDHHFYIHYFLLPALAVILICLAVYELRSKSHEDFSQKRYALFASLFFFILYIMNFQRGLVRHGFMERNDFTLDATFYLACTLFIFAYAPRKNSFSKYSVFFSSAFALMLVLKYFPIEKGPTPLEISLNSPSIATLDEQCENPLLSGRILINEKFEKETFGSIKNFLDENIRDDQTFMDFSNTPMLYYYCQRKVPSYFCQSQQNTVDDFLQFDHIKRMNPKNTPVVITNLQLWSESFSDGISNTMRQYLLAEYIFANYIPSRILNNRMIWLSKTMNMDDTNSSILQYVELVYPERYDGIAIALDKHFFSEKKSTLKRIQSARPFKEDDSMKYFKIEPSSRESNILLRVFIQNPLSDRNVEIDILDENKRPISNTLITCIEKQKTYTILLSNRYLWYNRTPKQLRISKWSGMIVEKVEFYKDERSKTDNH